MFITLHELAKKATLMITVAAEGDEMVRVNVTPMPADTKAKHNLPQPLSLLATPVEFDADFVAALSTWQAPKRSLIQQAQDAAGGAAPASKAPALPAPKADAKSDAKGEKPTRRARSGKGDDDKKTEDAVQAAAAATGEAAAAADQVMADTTGAGGAEASASGAAEPGQNSSQVAGAAAGDASGATATQATDGQTGVDVYTRDIFAEGTSTDGTVQPPAPEPSGPAVDNVKSMDIF